MSALTEIGLPSYFIASTVDWRNYRVELNYEQARRLEGQMIRFKNKEGEWSIGKVKKVRKDGLEIEELSNSSGSGDGYGFPFFGGPFFRPPIFFPFVGFGFGFPLFF